MLNHPHKLPPDDIADWHHIPIPALEFVPFRTRKQARESRDYQITLWLQRETTGPYYVKSGCVVSSGQLVNVYVFRDPTDAMMFSMRWS